MESITLSERDWDILMGRRYDCPSNEEPRVLANIEQQLTALRAAPVVMEEET